MPDASDTTSIEHRALTVTVRTPQRGHTVWGEKGYSKIPEEIINRPSFINDVPIL